MQSPPTSPRRRGRLQPKAPWLRPRHRWAEEFIAARMGPAVLCRPPVERFRRHNDREDRAFPHLDAPHDANAAGLIAELDVVASGLDASDSQALVVVDRSIPIILALVGITSPNAIEASNTRRILASGNVCIGCVAAIEEDLIRAADARYSAPCRNSWQRRVRSAQSASSRRGRPH